eukprot:7135946-Karenia_brevis.AAC.1
MLHRVTKWRAAWQQPLNSVTKKPAAAHPQVAVQDEIEAWQRIWQEKAPFEAPLWREANCRDLGPVDSHCIRGLCRRFKRYTGLGADMWHPWHIGWLSDGALKCLGRIWQWAERLRRWPAQIQMLIPFLASKDDGGGRPLGLEPTCVRLWEGARNDCMLEWDKLHSR